MLSVKVVLCGYCPCCNAGNGDHVLFKKLHSLLMKGLARETVEWKR